MPRRPRTGNGRRSLVAVAVVGLVVIALAGTAPAAPGDIVTFTDPGINAPGK